MTKTLSFYDSNVGSKFTFVNYFISYESNMISNDGVKLVFLPCQGVDRKMSY